MTPLEQTDTLADRQLLIYAQELNTLHQAQRAQLAELKQLYQDLQVKEQQRTHLMAQLLTAQEQERMRLSRDLHDGPLQDLGVLLLIVERCKRQIEANDAEGARATLARLRTDAQQMVERLRALVSDLRPPLLDTSGLLGALDHLIGQMGHETEVVIDISSRLGARLHPQLELVVFRLVQEALTNIRKHAQAQHAWIWLERRGPELYLEIRDDGQGFAVDERSQAALAGGHIGLAGMKERTEIADGHMFVESSPQQGTLLRFVLPFTAADAPAPDGLPLAVKDDDRDGQIN